MSLDYEKIKPEKSRSTKLDRLFLYQRGEVEWEQVQSFRGGSSSKKKQRQKILLSWTALLIDFLILLSLSCVFVLVFSFIVQTPFHHLKGVLLQSSVLNALLLCQIFCGAIYLIVARYFYGQTLGEWTCHLSLGDLHDYQQKGYLQKVILRTFLITVTGFVVLPVLSLIFAYDIAGQLSGLSHSERTSI